MSTQAGNKVNLSMSVSADGFVAGPNQNEDNPLGAIGGILALALLNVFVSGAFLL